MFKDKEIRILQNKNIYESKDFMFINIFNNVECLIITMEEDGKTFYSIKNIYLNEVGIELYVGMDILGISVDSIFAITDIGRKIVKKYLYDLIKDKANEFETIWKEDIFLTMLLESIKNRKNKTVYEVSERYYSNEALNSILDEVYLNNKMLYGYFDNQEEIISPKNRICDLKSISKMIGVTLTETVNRKLNS